METLFEHNNTEGCLADITYLEYLNTIMFLYHTET